MQETEIGRAILAMMWQRYLIKAISQITKVTLETRVLGGSIRKNLSPDSCGCIVSDVRRFEQGDESP